MLSSYTGLRGGRAAGLVRGKGEQLDPDIRPLSPAPLPPTPPPTTNRRYVMMRRIGIISWCHITPETFLI